MQPSPYDGWSAKEIIDLIAAASPLKPSLQAVFVVNRKIGNTAIGRDVAEPLATNEIPVLKSTVAQRVAFAESANAGKTVLETEPNGAAAQEIRALVAEVKELLA